MKILDIYWKISRDSWEYIGKYPEGRAGKVDFVLSFHRRRCPTLSGVVQDVVRRCPRRWPMRCPALSLRPNDAKTWHTILELICIFVGFRQKRTELPTECCKVRLLFLFPPTPREFSDPDARLGMLILLSISRATLSDVVQDVIRTLSGALSGRCPALSLHPNDAKT